MITDICSIASGATLFVSKGDVEAVQTYDSTQA